MHDKAKLEASTIKQEWLSPARSGKAGVGQEGDTVHHVDEDSMINLGANISPPAGITCASLRVVMAS